MARKRRYNAKQLRKRLEEDGWVKKTGGKHVILMTKPGHRPVTIPLHKGQTFDVGMSSDILKQAGIDDD